MRGNRIPPPQDFHYPRLRTSVPPRTPMEGQTAADYRWARNRILPAGTLPLGGQRGSPTRRLLLASLAWAGRSLAFAPARIQTLSSSVKTRGRRRRGRRAPTRGGRPTGAPSTITEYRQGKHLAIDNCASR